MVKFCKSLGPLCGSSSYNDLVGVYTVLCKNVGANEFIPSSLCLALFHQNSLHLHTQMIYFSIQVLQHLPGLNSIILNGSSMLLWNVRSKPLYCTVETPKECSWMVKFTVQTKCHYYHTAHLHSQITILKVFFSLCFYIKISQPNIHVICG